jgi:hypothetical protein
MHKLSILALALIGGFAGSLSAQTALKDVAHVREGIIAIGMAVEISDKCGSISPRTLQGINTLRGLQKHARDLGYSQAQIDAYVDDRAEKRRLEGIARERLADMGVVAGQESTYCAVGRAQISAGTAVGRLLR